MKIKKGKITSTNCTMLDAKHIANLIPIDLPASSFELLELDDPTSIPIVLTITPDDFKTLKKTGRSWDIHSILDIIKKYSEETYNKIYTMEKNL